MVMASLAVCALVTSCSSGQPATRRTTTVTVTPTPSTPATSDPSTTGTPTAAPATPPKSYAEAEQHFAAGQLDTAAGSGFTSPSGNIFCSISTDNGAPPAGCELKSGRIAPAADYCAGAAAPDIGRIELTAAGPKAVCNSDSIVQVGVPVLKYGAIAAVDSSPFRCLSETIGMTCLDVSAKKGFFIARSSYTIF